MIFLPIEVYHMRKNLGKSRTALDALRLKLLRAQIKNCYENVPYYTRIMNELGLQPDDFEELKDLAKLPIVTKDIIRQNYTDFFNRNFDMDTCCRSHSSGSTGEPFWTLYNATCWLRKKYLSKIRARMACGMGLGNKVAIFEAEGEELIAKKNRSFFLHTPVFRIKMFSLFAALEDTLRSFVSFNPHSAYGPPSFFFNLARALCKKNTPIPNLKQIFTSSEYLETNVRDYLCDAFKADVFDVYGSTELKEVAWECGAHGGYHINEDEVICEIVNDGHAADPGTVGDIVLTDLHNRVMPLIRYKIHDRGLILPEQCGCGITFRLMKPCAGRASEYITLPNGDELSPYFFTTSIEKIDGLLQYQIVQENKDTLTLRAIMRKDKKDSASEIKHILQKIIDYTMQIEVHIVSEIELERNGKFKVVKNLTTPHIL
jgi:phenylacetate-CoA ligase